MVVVGLTSKDSLHPRFQLAAGFYLLLPRSCQKARKQCYQLFGSFSWMPVLNCLFITIYHPQLSSAMKGCPLPSDKQLLDLFCFSMHSRTVLWVSNSLSQRRLLSLFRLRETTLCSHLGILSQTLACLQWFLHQLLR